MQLENIKLTKRNHFVAMEYYCLILNRTFLIIKIEGHLVGIQGNGLISTPGGSDLITQQITLAMAVKGDLYNPYAYLKESYLQKVMKLDLLDGSITKFSKTNFTIKITDINSARYNSRKKFGMGIYPHDGRVIIRVIAN
jgi:hypothetical protein